MFEDYTEQIKLEITHLDETILYINGLLKRTKDREADIYEKAAASTFLSQFYNGIENIIKRILKSRNISLPKGDDSHLKLFEYYSYDKNQHNLPVIFTEEIHEQFVILRRFRHFARHGYAFHLDWERLRLGLNSIEPIYCIFKINLSNSGII